MSEEWGPWIEHDGASVSGMIPQGAVLNILSINTGGITAGDIDGPIGLEFPGFFWRWKRVKTGWFRSEVRRVCDDPSYAPVVLYRIRKPRGMTILENLLADLPEKVDS